VNFPLVFRQQNLSSVAIRHVLFLKDRIVKRNRPLLTINQLETAAIFEDLSRLELQQISEFCAYLELYAGDNLISENDVGTADLYLLLQGQVEIITCGSGLTSDEISISKQDKELYGEISWLSGGKRTATVRCVSEVEAIKIEGDIFTNYLYENPKVGFFVMKHIAKLLSGRLDQTNNLLKQLLWNSNI